MAGGFEDRLDAGRRLALALDRYHGSTAVVLGMARGGVVVGYTVAGALDLPLQALVVRKIGAPANPELALGAVSETGVRWLDPYLVATTGASDSYLQQTIDREVAEAQRRQQEYAVGPGLDMVRGRTGIVVDDGIATGASALVAVQSVRGLGAAEVVLAVPVASTHAVRFLEPHVDRMVALDAPEQFYAVGMYYRHFDQVSDAEVVHYLQEANHQQGVTQ